MAGSIKSGSFGSQPSVQWELFYGDNDNWTLYGYKQAGWAFSYNAAAPGYWTATITLGTGQSTTVTIRPNYNVSAYDEFYVDFSFATPSSNTTISVNVSSGSYSSSGIGSFSGNYVVDTPSPPPTPTPTSTFDIQSVSVTATANSNFTWSFNVTMEVKKDVNTTLAPDVRITTNGMTFAETSGSRTGSASSYGTYVYRFTATGGNANTIKSLYSAYPSSSTLDLSLSLKMQSVWSYNGSFMYKDRPATASATLWIVTPPPTVSDGWFSTGVNNSASGGNGAFPYYIKGKSRVRVTFDKSKVNISNLCGATIAKCKATISGTSYSSANASTVIAFDTNVLTVPGNLTLTAVVVDTRGKEYALGSVTIPVYDYAEPTLSNISAYRCTASGLQDDKGTYICIRAKALPASVGGHNTVELKARYKPTSGSFGDYKAIANNIDSIAFGGLSTTSAYLVEIVATDTAGFSSVYTAFIPTEIAIFSVKNGGKAVGVGMFVDGEDDYSYHVAFDTYLHRDLILGNGTRLTEEKLIKLLALIEEG